MTLTPTVQSHIIAAIPYTVLFLVCLTVFNFDFVTLMAGVALGSTFNGLQRASEIALTKEAR